MMQLIQGLKMSIKLMILDEFHDVLDALLFFVLLMVLKLCMYYFLFKFPSKTKQQQKQKPKTTIK